MTAVAAGVVVVNWNAGPAIVDCLDSVAASRPSPAGVVVVDNASTDGSLAAVRGRHPGVTVVAHDENRGFAVGANAGAAAVAGDPLVFLNPDARVAPDAIARLVDALAARPDAGVAGGGLRAADGAWEPGSARFAPIPHLVLDTRLGRRRLRRRTAPCRVDWVYGTFMAVRRELFVALGGFDERYFCYGEDLDLCWRAAARGATTLYVPGAVAVHGRNVSATQRWGAARDAEVVKGELRFYAARRGRAAVAAYRAVGAAKFGLQATVAALAGRRERLARHAAVLRACLGFER